MNLFIRQRAANEHHGNKNGADPLYLGYRELVEGQHCFAYLVRKRILTEPNISVNTKDLGHWSRAGTLKKMGTRV